MAQALEDRLGGVDGVVLRDQQGAAERRFAGVVAVVLHTGGADAAAVVGGLEFVPVEVLHRRAFLLLALGLDQHHRQVAHLGEVARPAGRGRLGRVEALVFGTAGQFPEQLHQRGLARAGLTDQLQEQVGLVQLADLLGVQRAQPPGQHHRAAHAKAAPEQVEPLFVVVGQVGVDVQHR